SKNGRDANSAEGEFLLVGVGTTGAKRMSRVARPARKERPLPEVNVAFPLAIVEGIVAREPVAAEDVEVAAEPVVVLGVGFRCTGVDASEESVEGLEVDVISVRPLLDIELHELVEELGGRRPAEAVAPWRRFPSPWKRLAVRSGDDVRVDHGLVPKLVSPA